MSTIPSQLMSPRMHGVVVGVGVTVGVLVGVGVGVLVLAGVVVIVEVGVGVGVLPTNRCAVAVLPIPALVELTRPVVLIVSPLVSPTTFTLNVQEPPAAIEPPERFTTLEPPTAVITPAPQEPMRP